MIDSNAKLRSIQMPFCKQAQDMDRRRQEAEREQLQNEIAQLRQALELEKKRGFWSRLFGR